MKARISPLFCRLVFLGALMVAVFLLPARPAAACLDDPSCANWCNLACEEEFFRCGTNCYNYCWLTCYYGCAPDPC